MSYVDTTVREGEQSCVHIQYVFPVRHKVAPKLGILAHCFFGPAKTLKVIKFVEPQKTEIPLQPPQIFWFEIPVRSKSTYLRKDPVSSLLLRLIPCKVTTKRVLSGSFSGGRGFFFGNNHSIVDSLSLFGLHRKLVNLSSFGVGKKANLH